MTRGFVPWLPPIIVLNSQGFFSRAWSRQGVPLVEFMFTKIDAILGESSKRRKVLRGEYIVNNINLYAWNVNWSDIDLYL